MPEVQKQSSFNAQSFRDSDNYAGQIRLVKNFECYKPVNCKQLDSEDIKTRLLLISLLANKKLNDVERKAYQLLVNNKSNVIIANIPYNFFINEALVNVAISTAIDKAETTIFVTPNEDIAKKLNAVIKEKLKKILSQETFKSVKSLCSVYDINLESNNAPSILIVPIESLHKHILPNIFDWRHFFQDISKVFVVSFDLYSSVFGAHSIWVLHRLLRNLNFIKNNNELDYDIFITDSYYKGADNYYELIMNTLLPHENYSKEFLVFEYNNNWVQEERDLLFLAPAKMISIEFIRSQRNHNNNSNNNNIFENELRNIISILKDNAKGENKTLGIILNNPFCSKQILERLNSFNDENFKIVIGSSFYEIFSFEDEANLLAILFIGFTGANKRLQNQLQLIDKKIPVLVYNGYEPKNFFQVYCDSDLQYMRHLAYDQPEIKYTHEYLMAKELPEKNDRLKNDFIKAPYYEYATAQSPWHSNPFYADTVIEEKRQVLRTQDSTKPIDNNQISFYRVNNFIEAPYFLENNATPLQIEPHLKDYYNTLNLFHFFNNFCCKTSPGRNNHVSGEIQNDFKYVFETEKINISKTNADLKTQILNNNCFNIQKLETCNIKEKILEVIDYEFIANSNFADIETNIFCENSPVLFFSLCRTEKLKPDTQAVIYNTLANVIHSLFALIYDFPPLNVVIVPFQNPETNAWSLAFFDRHYKGGWVVSALQKWENEDWENLMTAVQKFLWNCACPYGCPNCIHPHYKKIPKEYEDIDTNKRYLLEFLEYIYSNNTNICSSSEYVVKYGATELLLKSEFDKIL